AAARRQARIDQGKDAIIGVNKYQVEEETEVDVREISESVREEQINWLNRIRKDRDEDEVRRTLEAVTNCAESGGNLLDACIPAIRARATVGEVTDAMEKVFGRYVATTQCISGVYAGEYQDDEIIGSIRKRVDEFAEKHGRRPRILLTKMGQDGHDRGVKVVATAYADLGFDVDLSPMFQTPAEAAKMAIENDVHVVGVSSLAGAHKILVPQMIEELKKQGGDNVLVVIGGIIPPADYEFLYNIGVARVFGPGSLVTDSANQVLNALTENA
ncbi:MAG: methylmalonyl-CoA mutase family protein, partial [Desulfovibrionales bacterium]